MAYTAYERTSGTSALQLVESLVRNRTNSGTFDSSSTPTLSQVESFLTLGSAQIGAMLVSYGYSQAQSDADVLAVLETWNAFSACEMIELTHPSAGGGFPGEERTSRLQVFSGWRKTAKEVLQSDALQAIGGNRTHPVSTGGVSISDKEVIEEDTDFEPYLFAKDKHSHPATVINNENDRIGQ